MVSSSKILKQNEQAIAKLYEFRAMDGVRTVHNSDFHRYKNQHPYMGFVDVNIGTSELTMFSNNDDVVVQCFFWFGPESYEAMSLKVFQDLAKNANFVFDIGAFTGLYSLCAADVNPASKIVAFEASRSTWERAKINFVANGFGSRIDLRNVALGDETGMVEFHHYRHPLVLQAGASFVQKSGKDVFSSEFVSVEVGDRVVQELGGLDLIKLDVEGAELSVLEGMSSSIASFKPSIIVEVEPSNFTDIMRFFDKLDYTIKSIDESGKCFRDRSVGSQSVTNYLALHNSKIASVSGF